MSRRNAIVLIVGLVLAGWFFSSQRQAEKPGRPPLSSGSVTSTAAPETSDIPASAVASPENVAAPVGTSANSPPTTTAPGTVATTPTEDRIALADSLNAPSGSIQRDLRILQDILAAWRSNFPRDGNPVGENVEITAALTGKNRFELALIPKDHSAVNPNGELCDRWGTPFRFHQISGDRMELRSAGPDRKFGTPDDALLEP
jgi:hypothetical protein